MTVETMEGQNFLTINGTQTMSHTYCNLMAELPELTAMGIKNFRLSPHDIDMVKICKLYRDRLDEKITFETASKTLEGELFNIEFSNGYYHGIAGLALTL